MSSIVAALVPADPLPYVHIDIVIDAPETVTAWSVTRQSVPANVVVRVGTASSGAASILDREAPLGIPFTYRLDITRGAASETLTSAVVSIDGTAGCFLSDPYSGKVVPINLQSWPERLSPARYEVLEILARPDPVVLSDVHTWPVGDWTLITLTDAELSALFDVLTSSGIVQLRTQPTSSIRSVYAAVGDIKEDRFTGQGSDQRRLTGVSIQEIAPIPAAARDTASTLQALSTLGATLTDLAAVRPTLLGLSQMEIPV